MQTNFHTKLLVEHVPLPKGDAVLPKAGAEAEAPNAEDEAPNPAGCVEPKTPVAVPLPNREPPV